MGNIDYGAGREISISLPPFSYQIFWQISHLDTNPSNYYNKLAFIMNIAYILTIIDMVVMVLLIISVALQNKSSGLSNVFGGGGGVVATRRGSDKWLFYATIILGVLFAGLSLTILLVSK